MKSVSVFFVVCAILFFVEAARVCPTPYSRVNWGGEQPRDVTPMDGKASKVIVRETGGRSCTSIGAYSPVIRSLQSYDLYSISEPDIDCSFLIDTSGHAYTGRGWKTKTSYGNVVVLCLIGDFSNTAASQSQVDALNSILSCNAHQLSSSYVIQAERDVKPTSNPGAKLYSIIQSLPRYKSQTA